jgi:ankyrin repeat protein
MTVRYRYPVAILILDLILGLSFGSQVTAAPIHDAVSSGDINRVLALIGPELAINEKNFGDMTAIQMAVRDDSPDIVKLLINSGADVNIGSTRLKFTPLHIAARKGDAELVNLLIDSGSVVNLPNHEGTSALHYAVRAGKNEIVELLIANGAEINIKDFEDYTPLHNAAWNGHLETVELLVSNGADINLATYDGHTAYRCAIDGKNSDVADFLEKLGAVQ